MVRADKVFPDLILSYQSDLQPSVTSWQSVARLNWKFSLNEAAIYSRDYQSSARLNPFLNSAKTNFMHVEQKYIILSMREKKWSCVCNYDTWYKQIFCKRYHKSYTALLCKKRDYWNIINWILLHEIILNCICSGIPFLWSQYVYKWFVIGNRCHLYILVLYRFKHAHVTMYHDKRILITKYIKSWPNGITDVIHVKQPRVWHRCFNYIFVFCLCLSVIESVHL
jgi:hypothetical protein